MDALNSLGSITSAAVIPDYGMVMSAGRESDDQDIEEPRNERDVDAIVGPSSAIRRVLHLIEKVAPTDADVLLLGETGTGKELLAHRIHDRSGRKARSFIKVDCASIPATLVESELFGHEKGAFTGASTRKLGRVEVADQGTLFLDEVSDLPLELQPKMLRFLQDRVFERLGGTDTHSLDVRIIAAANRDLREMVDSKEFRADLYYRLNVFPIEIPPLRERPEDIVPLARHYVNRYAKRMKKRIATIPAEALEIFQLYSWPGNVRELQHFMERAVILSSGSTLSAPLEGMKRSMAKPHTRPTPPDQPRTLEEIERESILAALQESRWVVGGPGGAAVKLGMKRTTLASRMQRLGILRHPS